MDKHIFSQTAWSRLSLFEQMGNIGSEVGRAVAAKRRGDQISSLAALRRGLDLIDVTAQIWSKQYPARLKELLRARELFVQSITTDVEDAGLESYFTQYAIAARLNR